MLPTTQFVVPNFVKRGLALLLIIAFPTIAIQAQDFEAVQKRLLKAVQKDELSLQQAAVMMEVLHEFSREQEMHEREWHEEHAEHDHRDHEHGDHEHGDHEHGDHEHDDHEHGEHEHEGAEDDRRMQQFKRTAMRIERAVEAGELSKQDAERRLMAMKKEIWGGKAENTWTEKEHDPRAVKFREMEMKLYRAVENGEISKEDAERKLVEMKKAIWGDNSKKKDNKGNQDREQQREKKMKFSSAESKIMEMIKSGKVSEEDGMARLKAFKNQLWPDLKDRKSQGDAKSKQKEQMAVRMRRFRMFENQTAQQVASGELTLEEANEKLEAVKTRMAIAERERKEREEREERNDDGRKR